MNSAAKKKARRPGGNNAQKNMIVKKQVKGNELTGQDNQVSLVRRAAWW
jgi:hypothetical protein